MKRFWRNFDPMYVVVIGFFAFISVVFYAAIQIDNRNIGFTEACITMGGTPLIGKYDTRVCFKSDAVLKN